MKITIHRAEAEPIVIEGEISSKGTDEETVDFQITGEKGQPWADVEMDGADAVEIGAWGMTWLADRHRATR